MYSTGQLANQYNWLPAAPIVNQGISNWSGPPSNISSGFGSPFEFGGNVFPSTGFMGDVMLDGQMPVPAMMINPSDPDQKYGVGILFAEKMDPAHPRFGYFEIFVKGIYEGSPADRSAITEGDILIEINGENIKGLSLRQIAPRIVGKLNSPVQLGFKRLKPELSPDKREIYAVDLVRSTLNTASPIDPKLLRDDVTAPKPPPVPEKPPPNPEDSDPFLKYSVTRLADLAGIGFSVQPGISSEPGAAAYSIAQTTPGSSAQEKGIEAGFWLVSIDGKPVKELSLTEVKVLLLGKEGERREIEYLNPRTGQEGRATVELDCQAEFQREPGARFLANSAGLGGVPMTPLHMPAAQPVFQQQPQMTVLQSPAFQPQPMPFFQGGLQAGPIMGGGGAVLLQQAPMIQQTPMLAAQPMPVLAYGGGGGFGGPVYF